MKQPLTKELISKCLNGASPYIKNKVKRLYLNEELIRFIQRILKIYKEADEQILILRFFKPLVLETVRMPDPYHYEAFKEEYREQQSQIEIKQKQIEPIKWIQAKIEFLEAEKMLKVPVKHKDLNLPIKKDWLSQSEVRAMFHFSRATLNRRMAEGMPCHKLGKFVYFSIEEITEWIKNAA